jgi:hypothetical protein
VIGRLLALAAAVALAAGCADDSGRFPVVIRTVTDDGRALPELPVRVGRSVAGKTDADGKLQIRIVGKEGARVAISVATPKGYRLASTAHAVILRRLTDVEGGGRPLPIEHVVRFAPLERQYAVMVRADVAGLPVEAFGQRQAVTNDKGVAIFLYQGTPGDELQVKLVTDGRPDLRPQNPTQSFLLAARSEAYLVKQNFAMVRKPQRHRPKHVGPKRL